MLNCKHHIELGPDDSVLSHCIWGKHSSLLLYFVCLFRFCNDIEKRGMSAPWGREGASNYVDKSGQGNGGGILLSKGCT